MTRATANLGGTASDLVVGKVAHGLMSMTWKENPVPDEQCFEAIVAGINVLPPGAKMFLNGGEFYGHDQSTTNLEMLARFFEKYPEHVDRTFLSIKGAIKPGTYDPDCSRENLTRSVTTVNEKLRGTKRLDLYESARIDPAVPVEEQIAVLAELKCQGKLDHIGMSECSAETLRRGHKVHPISVVEIEVSPFSYEEEARKVIATAKELGIAVVCYSPLGRGILTGQVGKPEDIPADDFRRHFPWFQEDNLRHNLTVVDALNEIARRKNVTTAQLCIGWVSSLGPHVIPMPGSSRADRTLENCSGGDVTFTEAECEELRRLIATSEVKGARYPSVVQHLWA